MTQPNVATTGRSGTVSEHQLYTACWKTALAQASDDVVLVRTSIGKPRWVPAQAIAQVEAIKELMPFGLMAKDLPWPNFVIGYERRLEAVGVSVFEEIFDEMRERHGGRPLVLLCFEHNPAECHRGVFARWWLEQTGVLIPEWPSGAHAHVCESAPDPVIQEQLI